MKEKVFNQTKLMIEEFAEQSKIKPGNILVVGCSTSEVIGAKIGTNSSPEIAGAIFDAIYDYTSKHGIHLAVQCCEHLNRAIVTEKNAVPYAESVNVIPQPKAGGSLAAYAYTHFENPVVLEEIKADAGIDIGFTLMGMHLKSVAVPLRLTNNIIGETSVVTARTRPKFIGGSRAVYNDGIG